jgi:hypothetical protein
MRGRSRVLSKLGRIAWLTLGEPRSRWYRFVPSFATILVLVACAALATLIGGSSEIERIDIKLIRMFLKGYIYDRRRLY